MANIKDIAKAAGVSVTTVSRVVNHHPYVSEAKRRAVEEAIQQLHYAPNHNAIHLVKGKTGMIGVMLPFVNNPYFSTLLEGISTEALERGYRLVLCQTDYEQEKELDALSLLRNHQIDGLLICSRSSSWDEIEAFREYGPIIACERVIDNCISSVYVDYYQSFAYGMRYLIEKGHRQIGYCIGRKESANSLMRQQAYQDALDQIGEPYREEWIFDQCLDIASGVDVVTKLLAMSRRPTALLVASDQAAAGIMTEAAKHGIRVPEDLALIGFDNHPIAALLSLTTIEHPSYLVGKAAFQLLHRQIMQKHEATKEDCEIRYTLTERNSV